MCVPRTEGGRTKTYSVILEERICLCVHRRESLDGIIPTAPNKDMQLLALVHNSGLSLSPSRIEYEREGMR